MHQVLFVLCVILSCNVSFGKSDTTKELEKINKNLVEKVPESEELTENTLALRQMLDGVSKFNVFNIEYRKALETLNYLAENRCDKTTIDHFELIDRSLHYEPREEEPTERLAKVVRQLLSRHAKVCLKIYQTAFHSKIVNLDGEKVGYVDTLLDSLYKKYDWRAQSSKDLFEYYIKSRSYGTKLIWWPNHISGVLKALQIDSAKDNSSIDVVEDKISIASAKGFNEEKLREIYNQYLVIPCKYYVNELGPEVFALANYDCSFNHHCMVDNEERNYYQSWLKYRTCEQLIVDDEHVFKLLINYI